MRSWRTRHPLRSGRLQRLQHGGPTTPADPAIPTPPALVQLRFRPFGARRALLQVELDTQAVRKLVRALGGLLAHGELSPQAGLPELHLVLVEKK